MTTKCSRQQDTTSVVTWMINGTLYSKSAAANNPLYQRSNPTDSLYYSLKVFSINHTTTFQCIIYSCLTTGSKVFLGTKRVTVTTGMYIAMYTVLLIAGEGMQPGLLPDQIQNQINYT